MTTVKRMRAQEKIKRGKCHGRGRRSISEIVWRNK